MAGYESVKGLRGRPKRVWWVVLAIFIIMVTGVVIVRQTYSASLGPVSKDQTTQIFTVESGSNFKQVAQELEEKKLIRSAWAMELYIHSKQLSGKLQAGTYALSPSQGTGSIASVLTQGKVTTRLVTILPGRRIDQIRADLINSGFLPEAVDAALNPEQYRDLPALSYKPADVSSLEGLLWPDSFQRNDETEPTVIIRQSLEQMSTKITPAIQEAFADNGLSIYQGITLASIVEKEASKPNDRSQAAQVFLKRIATNIPLGSDPTAFYGSVIAGNPPSLTFDSPYNTALYKGLPPSPISTISQSSLEAAAYPANTDWLYFVAGDDGTTHFSKTLEEHEALTDKYCTKLCGN